MTGFDRTRPFNDLPLLPPPVQLETPAVLKKAIGASRALAELKGAGHVIPNQAIFINSIVLHCDACGRLYPSAAGSASVSRAAGRAVRAWTLSAGGHASARDSRMIREGPNDVLC